MISLTDIMKHKTPPFFTPKWLTAITHLTPTAGISWLIEQRINLIFKTQINDGELDFLIDKQLCIDVDNLPLSLLISLNATSKRLTIFSIKPWLLPKEHLKYDGKLTGSSDTFLSLMSGKYDPDTLFFSRKLAIQGDTELCLTVKNWLDTQDPQASLPDWLFNQLTEYVESLQ
ncbi:MULTISPECIES: ubiquinone anaerobic biosynthesis accessory factor UbiT [Pseudoalteromonas]|jgi:predicted lipid carrier protein YhbT|uniref:Ubiquinone biosynthesis accessory factor UbiT n=2 Tax=Pseudoalteromonas TaxID=53246 RepID=A0AAD0S1E5_9GAMM|nr:MULTISPECIES: SCP2 sterol-binding domain-containing protein [Pseudoalteromonas]EWH05068.1 hypothetical protein AT00_16260 [Pseudoalteromonas lipolytica SCSIO 04301]QMW14047.1 SCP2 sterol-binding domain-containing protein [Pseudoalteromonas sp. MT33b]AXV66305.1 hypothetical protein D0907_13970 [Pseudoalteromonas donghaensis]MAE01152.1 hypothetical protein [Pseudoalteromonas sp.]QLJ07832.1 SCP2 sterol-binding domain-containing protein [Pseudoalteromonas sp. JSTW]|tara:strand:- start:2877 stop:3395 length:519 start_codon:yes stop_codon:yes gene_type:complete